jgi:hypothetical protein
MKIIEFPCRNRRADVGLRQIHSFADLVPTDPAIDARAAELMPEALQTLKYFSAEEVAEMLTYSAARLERVGFKMFGR